MRENGFGNNFHNRQNLANDYDPVLIGFLSVAATIEVGVVALILHVISKQLYSNYRMKKAGEDLTQDNYSGRYSI